MECKRRQSSALVKVKPRLIIHGGAGNIKPANLTPQRYQAMRKSLLGMVSLKTQIRNCAGDLGTDVRADGYF